MSDNAETSAYALAELVLAMEMVTPKGLAARQLARRVLGVADGTTEPATAAIVTNGTVRLVPRDEPVFLLRGQDALAANTVRWWAEKARAIGAVQTADIALAQAMKMDRWPTKKTPDWPPQHAYD
jgi:hypothetical protein